MGDFDAEVARAARVAGAGIGAPDDWEETKSEFLAEAAAQAAAVRELLVARIRAVIRAELVEQFDGGGWLKVDEFHSNWIELDGTVDIQELAVAIAAALAEGSV